MRWVSRLKGMTTARLPAAVHEQSVQETSRSLWRARMQADWDSVCQAAGTEEARDLDAYFIQQGGAFHPGARHIVTHAMLELQRNEMHARSTLQNLRRIALFKGVLQPYLKGHRSQGTHLKMQCRTGTLPVNALLNARRQVGDAACPLCGEPETVAHVLVQCPAYDEMRAKLFDELRDLFGVRQAAYCAFRASCVDAMVGNLLSDQYWAAMGKFTEANSAVCSFLRDMWAARLRYIADTAHGE
jgi:hypothetical protein